MKRAILLSVAILSVLSPEMGLRALARSTVALAPGTWIAAGPVNIGGRVTALAADPNNPMRIWLGAADGGVFRSTDGGASWLPVFDDQPAMPIGAIAAHPTDSNVVYVGTGEDNGTGYTFDGQGIFKTADGGTTWTSLGLAETRRIARIAIDPVNPQRVFVAAGGSVFLRDAHRGIYRSTDGGASWQQVLFVAEDAGGIDVAIDPASPSRVYAAIWQRSSTAGEWIGGGVNSGIWQSTDGGTHWARLTSGLPAASPSVGRIGLAIAPSSPQTVYAIYRDTPGGLMGIWKTTNAGAAWSRVDNPAGAHVIQFSSAGYYFGQIRVDPSDARVVYALDVYWYRSTDGGVKWQQKTSGIHVDHHDLVVLPGGRLLMGNDGGFYSSANGTNWAHAETLPISQLYAACFSRQNPALRLAGLQDNGTVRTTTGGTSDWSEVLLNDGMQCEFDPNDPSRVYAELKYGGIRRSTDGGRVFSGVTSGIDPAERRNWNTPLTHDPVTSRRLYTGTIRVYRSVDGADSWTAISPDLTNGPSLAARAAVIAGAARGTGRKRLAGPGSAARLRWDWRKGGRDHANDTVQGTITTIGVSPVNTSIIWAGTDDGNVWVTENAGQSWTKVGPLGYSQWVTSVEADPFDARTAYLTLSSWREGSMTPHILRTTTLGASWTDISGNLPPSSLTCIATDPDWRARLFVGTDAGVFITENGGAAWSRMKTGLPPAVVLDLDLIESTRTLFAATHGRSLFSFDLGQLPAPDQDGDGDGVVNSQDCAPDDPGAFAVPAEVAGLAIASRGLSITWVSAAPGAGNGTVHDLLRGDLRQLPVGTGGAEACIERGILPAASGDAAVPAPGSGFWYVVRGRNACGPGTWGARSDGTPRPSAVCD